jgi:hypothetical protein
MAARDTADQALKCKTGAARACTVRFTCELQPIPMGLAGKIEWYATVTL